MVVQAQGGFEVELSSHGCNHSKCTARHSVHSFVCVVNNHPVSLSASNRLIFILNEFMNRSIRGSSQCVAVLTILRPRSAGFQAIGFRVEYTSKVCSPWCRLGAYTRILLVTYMIWEDTIQSELDTVSGTEHAGTQNRCEAVAP